MALTGLHVSCGYIGGVGPNGQVQTLAQKPTWSQTLTGTANTGTLSAPNGVPCMEIRVSADSYVAIGPNPDATVVTSNNTNNARMFVPANETRNVFVSPGDKIAFVNA